MRKMFRELLGYVLAWVSSHRARFRGITCCDKLVTVIIIIVLITIVLITIVLLNIVVVIVIILIIIIKVISILIVVIILITGFTKCFSSP